MSTSQTFDRDAIVDHMQQQPLFAGCSKRQLRSLSRHCGFVQLEPGMDLIVEGAPSSNAYIVLAGDAQVTRGGEVIGEIGAGDFAGELGLLSERDRKATVTAVSAIEALVLSTEALREAVDDIDGLGWSLITAVVHRLEDAEDH